MRSHAFDGRESIPTFDDVLALATRLGRARGRPVGVYPELKHPSYFRRLGLPLEPRLIAALRRHGRDQRAAAVFVQSFERDALRRLRPQLRVRLVLLVSATGALPEARDTSYASLLTPDGLRRVAEFADAIGVEKRLVLPTDSTDATPIATTLVRDAHAAGLLVHVWTMRSDSAFLPRAWRGDAAAEVRAFAAAGVDGLFTDFPGTAVRILRGAP
jgi:glycerophosphoryl diester phosphodiesterase